MSEDLVAPRLEVDWPVGPELVDLDARQGVYAWVAFKLVSADWYVDRLEALLELVPQAEHQVGVEMALDGVLSSLCSAVDAACAGVIEAAEARLSKPKATPKHQYGPQLAAQLLRECGRKRTPAALDAARRGGSTNSPEGWFAQLGRIRNTVVHRSALGRTHYVGGHLDGGVHMDIPGLGAKDPVVYLRGARVKVVRLSEQLLKEVTWLAPGQVVGQPSRSVTVTPETARAS